MAQGPRPTALNNSTTMGQDEAVVSICQQQQMRLHHRSHQMRSLQGLPRQTPHQGRGGRPLQQAPAACLAPSMAAIPNHRPKDHTPLTSAVEAPLCLITMAVAKWVSPSHSLRFQCAACFSRCHSPTNAHSKACEACLTLPTTCARV